MEDIAELLAQLNKPTEDGQSFPPFYLSQAFIERLISLARYSQPRIANS